MKSHRGILEDLSVGRGARGDLSKPIVGLGGFVSQHLGPEESRSGLQRPLKALSTEGKAGFVGGYVAR